MKEKRLLMVLITITTIFLGAVIYLIASNNTADVSTYNTIPVVDYSNNQNDKIDYDSIEEDFGSIKTTTQQFEYDYSNFENSIASIVKITTKSKYDLLKAEDEYGTGYNTVDAKWSFYWKLNDLLNEYGDHYKKFEESDKPTDEEGIRIRNTALNMSKVYGKMLYIMLMSVQEDDPKTYATSRELLPEFSERVLDFIKNDIVPYFKYQIN